MILKLFTESPSASAFLLLGFYAFSSNFRFQTSNTNILPFDDLSLSKLFTQGEVFSHIFLSSEKLVHNFEIFFTHQEFTKKLLTSSCGYFFWVDFQLVHLLDITVWCRSIKWTCLPNKHFVVFEGNNFSGQFLLIWGLLGVFLAAGQSPWRL